MLLSSLDVLDRDVLDIHHLFFPNLPFSNMKHVPLTFWEITAVLASLSSSTAKISSNFYLFLELAISTSWKPTLSPGTASERLVVEKEVPHLLRQSILSWCPWQRRSWHSSSLFWKWCLLILIYRRLLNCFSWKRIFLSSTFILSSSFYCLTLHSSFWHILSFHFQFFIWNLCWSSWTSPH